MTKRIKKCPFCGSQDVSLVLHTLPDDDDITRAWGWAVVCKFCDACGPPVYHYTDMPLPDRFLKKTIKSAQIEAIRRWNEGGKNEG